MTLDLDETLSALSQTAGRDPRPFRVVLARHTDLWRATLGVALRAPDAVLPAGALDATGRGLLDLLVGTAEICAPLREAALAVVKASPTPSFTAGRVFPAPCERLQGWLPHARVRAEPVRAEELLRHWAAANGVRLRRHGRLEPKAQAARALKRLDFRQVATGEAALDRERTLLEARRLVMKRIAKGGTL